MNCPACAANLGKINGKGEPMVRGRGLVLKADGAVMLCPKCGGDVQFTREIATALNSRLFLLPGRRVERGRP